MPVVILVVAVAAVAIYVLIRWSRGAVMPMGLHFGGDKSRLAKVANARGAARCLAAHEMLADLAQKRNSARIAKAWPELEVLLLEALPDCPPALKAQLAEDLANCSAACRVRAVAQGCMTMRNSLV